MKRRKENGIIYLNFGYNMTFANKLKKYCGAKWKADTKEWYFDEEFEEKSNNLMLNDYGFSYRSDEKITVEMLANDFVIDRGTTTVVGINNVDLVWRESRDCDVCIANNVIILEGEFPKRGGSAKYPSVWINEEDGIVLRVELYKEFYETLEEEDKNKLKIIKELSKKEKLIAEKERILKELENIERELAKFEN